MHSSGIRVAVTDLGATLVSLEVPEGSGRMGDVVLGLSRAEDYAAHGGYYFGSIVGRFGCCSLHGEEGCPGNLRATVMYRVVLER